MESYDKLLNEVLNLRRKVVQLEFQNIGLKSKNLDLEHINAELVKRNQDLLKKPNCIAEIQLRDELNQALAKIVLMEEEIANQKKIFEDRTVKTWRALSAERLARKYFALDAKREFSRGSDLAIRRRKWRKRAFGKLEECKRLKENMSKDVNPVANNSPMEADCSDEISLMASNCSFSLNFDEEELCEGSGCKRKKVKNSTGGKKKTKANLKRYNSMNESEKITFCSKCHRKFC